MGFGARFGGLLVVHLILVCMGTYGILESRVGQKLCFQCFARENFPEFFVIDKVLISRAGAKTEGRKNAGRPGDENAQ